MAFLYRCDNCGKETGPDNHVMITIRSGGAYTVGQFNLDFCTECFGLKIDSGVDLEEVKKDTLSILKLMINKALKEDIFKSTVVVEGVNEELL
jgi:hypothetical protein